jgi:hypothetical protein
MPRLAGEFDSEQGQDMELKRKQFTRAQEFFAILTAEQDRDPLYSVLYGEAIKQAVVACWWALENRTWEPRSATGNASKGGDADVPGSRSSPAKDLMSGPLLYAPGNDKCQVLAFRLPLVEKWLQHCAKSFYENTIFQHEDMKAMPWKNQDVRDIWSFDTNAREPKEGRQGWSRERWERWREVLLAYSLDTTLGSELQGCANACVGHINAAMKPSETA